MDNQENKPGTSGTPMAGDDVRMKNAGTSTGSTGLGNDAFATGNASGPRKTTSARPAAPASPAAATDGSQPEGQQAGTVLDTALESGKKWIEDSGVLNSVNQFPPSVKEWGSRAVSRVSDLTTTQKIVGGALLAAGIGWLATRKGKSASSPDYGRQSSGNYGRRTSGYQAPDASTSRRSESGAASRSDSGSAYGNSGSRYGGSGASYSGSSGSHDSGSTNAGSGRNESGQSASPSPSSHSGDFGAHTSESSYRSKNDDFRSIE